MMISDLKYERKNKIELKKVLLSYDKTSFSVVGTFILCIDDLLKSCITEQNITPGSADRILQGKSFGVVNILLLLESWSDWWGILRHIKINFYFKVKVKSKVHHSAGLRLAFADLLP